MKIVTGIRDRYESAVLLLDSFGFGEAEGNEPKEQVVDKHDGRSVKLGHSGMNSPGYCCAVPNQKSCGILCVKGILFGLTGGVLLMSKSTMGRSPIILM